MPRTRRRSCARHLPMGPSLPPLSPCQFRTYQLRAQGLTNNQIAEEMGVTLESVGVYYMKGAKNMGFVGQGCLAATLNALRNEGWVARSDEVDWRIANTHAVQAAYLAAPAGEREGMFVRELLDLVLADARR